MLFSLPALLFFLPALATVLDDQTQTVEGVTVHWVVEDTNGPNTPYTLFMDWENTNECDMTVNYTVLDTSTNIVHSGIGSFEFVIPAKSTHISHNFVQWQVDVAVSFQWWFEYNINWGDIAAVPDNNCYALPYDTAVTQLVVTQGNNEPFSHNGREAFAFDWACTEGEQILAARGGVVTQIKQDSSTGCGEEMCVDDTNFIHIWHDDGTFGHYYNIQHNGCPVSVGDVVAMGDMIATCGNTGFSTGAHIHFAVAQPMGAIYYLETVEIEFCDCNAQRYVPACGVEYPVTLCCPQGTTCTPKPSPPPTPKPTPQPTHSCPPTVPSCPWTSICECTGDPHCRQFDGFNYDAYETGDFIMYESSFLKLYTRHQQGATYHNAAGVTSIYISGSLMNDQELEIHTASNSAGTPAIVRLNGVDAAAATLSAYMDVCDELMGLANICACEFSDWRFYIRFGTMTSIEMTLWDAWEGWSNVYLRMDPQLQAVTDKGLCMHKGGNELPWDPWTDNYDNANDLKCNADPFTYVGPNGNTQQVKGDFCVTGNRRRSTPLLNSLRRRTSYDVNTDCDATLKAQAETHCAACGLVEYKAPAGTEGFSLTTSDARSACILDVCMGGSLDNAKGQLDGCLADRVAQAEPADREALCQGDGLVYSAYFKGCVRPEEEQATEQLKAARAAATNAPTGAPTFNWIHQAKTDPIFYAMVGGALLAGCLCFLVVYLRCLKDSKQDKGPGTFGAEMTNTSKIVVSLAKSSNVQVLPSPIKATPNNGRSEIFVGSPTYGRSPSGHGEDTAV